MHLTDVSEVLLSDFDFQRLEEKGLHILDSETVELKKVNRSSCEKFYIQ